MAGILSPFYSKNIILIIVSIFQKDPPIKRFAQRHMYLDTDAIADGDLGFALLVKPRLLTHWERVRLNPSLLSTSTPRGSFTGL
jgi:cleavage stimulation factor subunit 3